MSENLWDAVLTRVEAKVNRHSFATWFRPTSYLSRDSQTLRIAVPNAQFREWLSKNYLGVLQEALAEAGEPGLRVVFDRPRIRLKSPRRDGTHETSFASLCSPRSWGRRRRAS